MSFFTLHPQTTSEVLHPFLNILCPIHPPTHLNLTSVTLFSKMLNLSRLFIAPNEKLNVFHYHVQLLLSNVCNAVFITL